MKGTLPSYTGNIRGSSLPTTTRQPIPGHKSYPASPSHPKKTETKHQLGIIILDLQGHTGWRAPWGHPAPRCHSRLGQHPPGPSAWLGGIVCTAGAQARAISNVSVLARLGPHHLLLLGKSASVLGKAPGLLCSLFQRCCPDWKTPSASICTVLQYCRMVYIVSLLYYSFRYAN